MLLTDCDLHVHTKFSFDGAADGSGEPEAVADAAIAAGLRAIALTDHCDIDDVLDGIYPPYPAGAIHSAVERLKADFSGRLEILRGIELGEPHARPDEAKKLLSERNFDFVIGSLHNLRGYPDFYFLRFERMEEMQLVHIARRMINELRDIVEFEYNFRHIDSLAHITYMSRYLDECGVEFDLTRFDAEWRGLFRSMIDCGVALEINTSGLRKGGKLMPDAPLVSLYADTGGRLFTLGSDAHTARDVGKNLLDAAKLIPDASLGLLPKGLGEPNIE